MKGGEFRMVELTTTIERFRQIVFSSWDDENNQIQSGLKIKTCISTELFTLIPWPEMSVLYRCHSICNDHCGLDCEAIYATAESLVRNMPRHNGAQCLRMVRNYDSFQYLLQFTDSFFILGASMTPALSLTTDSHGLAIGINSRFTYISDRPQFWTTIEGQILAENSENNKKELGLMFYREKDQIVKSIDRAFAIDYEKIIECIRLFDV